MPSHESDLVELQRLAVDMQTTAEVHADVLAANDPDLQVYLWALRVVLDARADGTPASTFTRDRDIEASGTVALDRITAARAVRDAARRALGKKIAASVGIFQVGDQVITPLSYNEPLTVAAVYMPGDEQLIEVTFTADGGPIIATAHSWPLDADGHPVIDDEPTVRYERWWAGGVRVAGYVHPETRCLIL